MGNLSAKILFVVLVATTVWVGVNILSVGSGKGLVAAGLFSGSARAVALPASGAPSSATAAALPTGKAATLEQVAKRNDDTGSGNKGQAVGQPVQGTATAGDKTEPQVKENASKLGQGSAGQPSPLAEALPPSFEQLTVLAALCGALGATLHALGSLVAFVGNGRFSSGWSMWYLAQPVRGAVLASGVYWAWYGNLLDASSAGAAKSGASALGLMFMVGLFSDPALEKLREVFMVLFRTAEKRRSDPLDGGRKPVIAKLIAGPAGAVNQIEIEGEGFEAGDEVTVGGAAQKILSQTATKLVVALPSIAAVGTKLVVVVKPTAKGAIASAPASVVVN